MVVATVRLLRTASIVICLIVIGSFATFAIDQTKTASAAQQEELAGGPIRPTTASTGGPGAASAPAPTSATATATATATTKTQPTAKQEGDLHKTLDDASNAFTSPFSGILGSSDSEWATRGVRMLLALLVYGFGLGYLARVLRVRV